ncbi:MAG TPA: phenylalanine--tRNA ligase subunit beta [Bacillus bacterium]|uniref:Phenylalanine--tRNA ligase beta subunit n=1 Tax=Siminovitchia fordii TaxID=254759 RepID=A0ABQ4KB91_9BACI|nr:phenylalanine--tRNA ligase subunit beta [Siminovitchia fordii]GIN22123.1 phenylalanine--tRNA ligase beta subunit [Siminovitchia fordii]HBZ09378.1 phenylalanine--tRNA ligase subunit beta [Bacillus sp. (in: firmicutes)]
MLVSYKWLQEYVNLNDVSAAELAEKITRSGIEVDGVVQLSEGVKDVVVGEVLDCNQHPQADKLKICKVDIGEGEPVQIICGAPNVAKGQKVPVAKAGAVLPGNFKIKRAKLRGEESNGMICSLQELGIEGKLVPKEFAEGIYVFPADAEVGSNALSLLNMDDEVLELDLTPNRADALSMIGVAYEAAAILDESVQLPEIAYESAKEKASDYISVKVEASKENPLYTAKVIKNVKIGPSPLWMQGRLMSAGIRPHNNVVDITNYILLEYGQPLHAFDYDRFGSKEVVIRMAKEGEKITTLDDTERTLTSDQLVITNGSVPVALAGVMGGADSEVSDDTTTILLESAYFTGGSIRSTSKYHGLRSEASSRYEKGVDPDRVRPAAERAAQLIAKYAGGEVLEGLVEDDQLTIEPAVVTISLEKINRVLGTGITSAEVVSIFNRLQFEVTVEEDVFTVSVPTRRGDITIEEDLIEEVARLYGYDLLPKTLPRGEATPGGLSKLQEKRRTARGFLEGAGMFQAITYSLTSEEKASLFSIEKRPPVQLAMPMSEERSRLRLSLVPQMLEAISYNVARKNNSVALYEIGSVFLNEGEGKQPEEREHIAGAVTGLWVDNAWQGEKKPVDFFVVKGILEGLFKKLGIEKDIVWQAVQMDGMHPGRTAEVLLCGEVIGFAGQVHPNLQKDLDLKDTYVFEIQAEPVFDYKLPELRYVPIPRYPSIARDIALVVDKDVNAATLESIIKDSGKKLLRDVHVFDLYEGQNMEEGKKSIAFSLTYADPERTLTDEEVTNIHEKVLAALKEKSGAELRS